jgi:simple sugar transport system ATP-binding protein
VKLRSVAQARSLGIETVYQDLALIDQLPVYLNMNLNKEPVRRPLPFLDKRRMQKEAREKLDDMGVRVGSIDTEVGFLSGGQRQAVAVARAVYTDAKVILLDEPLAAMGAKESRIILDLIHEIKQRGNVSMIMIAHNFAQIIDVCDRINFLQHGEVTYDKKVGETSARELTELVSAEYRGRPSSRSNGVG